MQVPGVNAGECLAISTTRARRATRWAVAHTRRPCLPNVAVHSDPVDRLPGSSLHRLADRLY